MTIARTADSVPDSDLTLLRAAITASVRAVEHGNHPFGAVLADASGTILLEAENTVTTDRDITGHAETNLVRMAWASFTAAELRDTVLATSCEPCAMCSGAIYWSGIGRVVYALAETSLAGLTGNDPENPTMALPCRTVLGSGQRPIPVSGPALEYEAAVPHDHFWRPRS